MTDLARELGVRRVVARLANTIDTHQWTELRALLAEDLTTDYTSLFGGEVQHVRGDDLIEMWRRLLSPLDATQHLVGAIEVQLHGSRAVAICHVRGYHVAARAPGGSEWMVAGQWVIEMVEREPEWLVTAITLKALYQTGNRSLLQEVSLTAPSVTLR